MRPVFLLVGRVGRIASRMRRGRRNGLGHWLSKRCPAAGRTATTQPGQILELQPVIFTEQSAPRFVFFAGPIRREKSTPYAVQCFADRDIASWSELIHRKCNDGFGGSWNGAYARRWKVP